MKYKKRLSLLAMIAVASTLSAANQGETVAQAKVRAQMARFWQVAESRVAEAEVPSPSVEATESPVRPLHAVPSASYRPAPLGPPPTVTTIQSVDRDQDAGHFGLRLFGGLRLFDFTWGEESVRERDAIEGRL